jgi:hypothetical protein
MRYPLAVFLCLTGSARASDAPILLNPGPLPDGAAYGYSIAVGENRIAVGAAIDSTLADFSGRAFLFDATHGSLIQILQPQSPAIGDFFGCAMAVGSGYIAVGSWGDDTLALNSGQVSLFELLSGAFIRNILSPAGTDAVRFGEKVLRASDGTLLVYGGFHSNGGVGSSIYAFDPATDAVISEIRPSIPEVDDSFGLSLAEHNGLLAVGARDANQGADSRAGAVYLFNLATGEELAKIQGPSDRTLEQFGNAVAITTDRLAISERSLGNSAFDSVYLYDISDLESPALIGRFDGPDAPGAFAPAASLLFSHDRLLVGKPSRTFSTDSYGVVDTYNAASGAFIERLHAPTPESTDQFGSAIGADHQTLVVGATQATGFNPGTGTAFMYRTTEVCAADFTEPNGILDFFDVAAFLEAFAQRSPTADLAAPAGVLNFFDIEAFLVSYSKGCP